MLLCDSRDWKNYSKPLRDFMALHGHYCCDIVAASQSYSDCDENPKPRRAFVLCEASWHVRLHYAYSKTPGALMRLFIGRLLLWNPRFHLASSASALVEEV